MQRSKALSRLALVAALVAPPATAAVLHVPSGGNLQQAIDQAQPGDTITLAARATYTGNFRLRNKTGTDYITITSADASSLPPAGTRVSPAAAAAFPKIKAPNSSPAIATDTGAHHYRLVGLEIYPAAGIYSYEIIAVGSSAATQASEQGSDIELDRLYIHGDPTRGGKRGISLNNAGAVIKNCWISGFRSNTQEAQAIGGWNGPGAFTITNNYLEAAGEGVLFGGATPKIQNLVSSDIVIKSNHFYRPTSWRNGDPNYIGTASVVRNLLQFQNARRALVEGNVFEHNWDTSTALGYAIEFNVKCNRGASPWSVVEDITFIRNVIRKSAGGVSVVGRDPNSSGQGAARRILVKDNLFYDISQSPWGGSGRLFQVTAGAEDVTFDHNTAMQETGTAMLYFEGEATPRTTFNNNIAPHGVAGVIGAGQTTGTPTLEFYSAGYRFARNVMAGGTAALYPADNHFPADIAAIGFVDAAADDYRLSAASPYRSGATDGRDIGADIDGLLALTRGVTDIGATQVQPEHEPEAVSVNPSSGQGSPQTFQLVYSDADGYGDLAWGHLLVNSSLSQSGACYVKYKASQNTLFLRDDAGSQWLGPVAVGSTGSLQNKQCTLHAASVSVSGSGNVLTVTLPLVFRPSFIGTKNLYIVAVDRAGRSSNWQLRGTWLPHVNAAPRIVSVTPSQGTGGSQVFQLAYADPNGFEDIEWSYVLINNKLDQRNACYVYLRSSTNTLWLRNDEGTGWLGPAALGAPGALNNSACLVDAGGSSKSGTGETRLVNLAPQFSPRFNGDKEVHLFAADRNGLTAAWLKSGTWTVPGTPPEAVSVTPSSGQGSTRTFRFVYSDAQGYGDIGWTYALVHSAVASSGGCYIQYIPATNAIYLRNDAGSLWLGPLVLGSPGFLSNSRCTIDISASHASGSGDALSVNLALRFSAYMAGARNIYMQGVDKKNLSSGWQLRGTWTVPN